MSKIIPNFDLPGGYKIPSIGLGTLVRQIPSNESIIESALEAGYRLFDTATAYNNEKVIGNVLSKWIKSGKLKREELFLITKLPSQGMRPSGVRKYVQQSLENLQVDYIDLYLIHSPIGIQETTDAVQSLQRSGMNLDMTTDLVAIWKTMEEEVKAGRLKHIGLSNFNIRQIQRIIDNATVPVANLQVELHAYYRQKEKIQFCKKNNITVTSYFTLGSPYFEEYINKSFGKKVEKPPSILEDPVVKAIATKHHKTSAQVLLRHLHQEGILLIPTSSNPGRQRENLDIFHFELDSDDLDKLDGLDQGDDGSRSFLKHFKDFQDHPEFPLKK